MERKELTLFEQPYLLLCNVFKKGGEESTTGGMRYGQSRVKRSYFACFVVEVLVGLWLMRGRLTNFWIF